jgi:hypothetical protein
MEPGVKPRRLGVLDLMVTTALAATVCAVIGGALRSELAAMKKLGVIGLAIAEPLLVIAAWVCSGHESVRDGAVEALQVGWFLVLSFLALAGLVILHMVDPGSALTTEGVILGLLFYLTTWT